MRFLCWIFLVLTCACGARSELDGGGSGAGGGHDTSCNEPPWILFDYSDGHSGFGISAIRLDGSSFHTLDLGEVLTSDPSISPDGASLLYITSSNDEDQSLMLLDLATRMKRTIVHKTNQPLGSGIGRAAVSPDNTLIAYGDSLNLNLVAFDGSNNHVLVDGPYEAGCCLWGYGRATFSGDSSTVFFSTVGRLESIHTDGSSRQLLEQDQAFTNPSIPGFIFPAPSLSPDFANIVAEVACDVTELRIYPVAALPGDACSTGTKLVETHLSMASNEASNPSWSPASLIAYDDGADIFVIDSTGGAPKNLTASITGAQGASASSPVWAPGCANIP